MPTELEQALAVVRATIQHAPAEQWQLALIALDIVAAPARALDALEGVPSWFTVTLPSGVIELNAQDAACERMWSVTGVTLREALVQAAHVVTLNQRADAVEQRDPV